jgi:hypothetical protein
MIFVFALRFSLVAIGRCDRARRSILVPGWRKADFVSQQSDFSVFHGRAFKPAIQTIRAAAAIRKYRLPHRIARRHSTQFRNVSGTASLADGDGSRCRRKHRE